MCIKLNGKETEYLGAEHRLGWKGKELHDMRVSEGVFLLRILQDLQSYIKTRSCTFSRTALCCTNVFKNCTAF